MTDDEAVIARAVELCERGVVRGTALHILKPRLRKIIADDDAFEVRYLLPALVEIIERRGLR